MISVLYVDDEPALLDLTRRFLEQQRDYSVDTAVSARLALEKIAARPYDIIVSDYQMPEMDGIEFLRALRAAGITTPFIIFTGRGREEVVIQALNEGADFYLQKGGDPRAQFAELVHKIRQAVQQRRAEARIRDHERREADIINFLPDATFAIDTSGQVIAWNRAMEKMTGIPAADMLGQGDYAYAIPFYRERRPILIDLIFGSPEMVAGKYPYIRRDGDTYFSEIFIPHLNGGRGAYLWFTASPLYDTAGRTIGAIESIRDITERKAAEDALRESSDRYKSFIAVSNTGAWEYHRSRDYLWCSQEYFSMLGRDVAEYDMAGTANLRETWIDMLHPDDRERASEHFRHYLESGPECMYENHFRMQHADGRWIWIWSRGQTLRDRNGNLTDRTVGTHIDVTESVLAQEALRESEENYRHLFENATEGILIAQDDRLVRVNPLLAEMLGHPPDYIMARPFTDFIHPDDREMVLDRHIRRMRGEDVPRRYEFRVINGEGAVRWAEITATRITWSGRPASLSYILDITGRKLAEEKLREQEQQYQNVVEDQTEFISRFLPDGTLVFVNEAYCRYFGLHREEVIGSRFRPTVHPDDRSRVRDFLASLGPADPVRSIDHRVTMPDGSIRWQRWSIRAIFCTDGAVREYQSVGRDITESKAVEVRLRESEELLHNFINNLPLGLYRNTPGPGGRYLMANPSIARMHGYDTLEEFMSAVTADLYENPAERIRFSDELVRTGRVTGRELRLRRKSGETFWGRVSAVAVRGPGGEVGYFDGFVEDVTDRKHAEEALRESEEKYRLIADNTADNIWIFDMDFRLRYVSPSVEKMKGFTVEESLAQSVEEMLTPASYAALLQRFGEEMALEATGTADPDRKVSFETEEYCRDGSTIHVENLVTFLRDEQGRPVGMLGVSRDITSRKRAEAALLESEEKYRNLVENLSEILYILDDQARVTYISPNIESIGGYTPAEVIGKRFIDFVHPDDREERPGQFERVLAGSTEPSEYRFIARDGRVVWVRTAGRPVTREGRITGVHGALTDITDRKQAEETLQVAHRKLQILSGITRHDILNQVMALQGFLELAADAGSGPEQAEYLARAGTAAAAIMLHSDFTRMYEEIGLNTPVWLPLPYLLGMISDRRLPLRNDCGRLSIYADPMIEKVFSNLMDNTLRHGTGATGVVLSCEESGGTLRLIWADDGPGIPAGQKERIFERGIGGNTGFGLFLAREILAITGMTITETGEPGKGARFEILVPHGAWRQDHPG